MGSTQSKIRGSQTTNPTDSTIIKDFVKDSFSNICHIDDTSTETLNKIFNTDPVSQENPNRFTVKAILKSPTDSLDNSISPQSSTSSKSSVAFQLDHPIQPISPTISNVTCWSCYASKPVETSFESYTPSSKSSIQSLPAPSLRSIRMSTASLSSRRSTNVEHPPIYQNSNGEFYIAFDESKYVFSSGYICEIQLDGNSFTSSAQCYLYQKALFHNNKLIANQILSENHDVDSLKNMMTPLNLMSHDRWSRARVGIMRRICMEKFEQNPTLRIELFRSGNSTLVAAIPDSRWGIGLNADDPQVADISNWEGSNLLGQILMATRTLLAAQYPEEYQNEQLVAERRQQKCIRVN